VEGSLRLGLGRSYGEVVHHGANPGHGRGIGRSRAAFALAGDRAGEGDDAVGRLHRNLLVQDRLVGADLTLDFSGNFCIAAGM
jgi:hypothetical protein